MKRRARTSRTGTKTTWIETDQLNASVLDDEVIIKRIIYDAARKHSRACGHISAMIKNGTTIEKIQKFLETV
jgi:hypothetical protein